MTSEQYTRLTRWWRERPGRVAALSAVNRVLTYLCYLLYPLLLVLAACADAGLFARLFLVPLAGFVFTSLLRRVVDEPRPYEALEIDPLMHKDTRGRSFPSRHIFSIFMIAMSWLCVSVPMGALLLVLGCVMAAIRVIGGVHYPRDIIAGAALAVVIGIVGFWAIPW